jgi:hypothetical protein
MNVGGAGMNDATDLDQDGQGDVEHAGLDGVHVESPVLVPSGIQNVCHKCTNREKKIFPC